MTQNAKSMKTDPSQLNTYFLGDGSPLKFNGVLIAYEDGDEPEEFDDEVRESLSDEEGEEEPEDILIVEAEENYPDDSSPDVVAAKKNPL